MPMYILQNMITFGFHKFDRVLLVEEFAALAHVFLSQTDGLFDWDLFLASTHRPSGILLGLLRHFGSVH